MKYRFFLSVCVVFSVIITSCATAIKDTKNVIEYEMVSSNQKETQMEFIGYKADTNLLSTTPETVTQGRTSYTVMSPFDQWRAISGTSALRQIGHSLQEKNIATDQSFAYFGIYSLQELELYKSRTRYVTFIEVVKNQYTIDESGLNQKLIGSIGAGLLGGGIFLNICGAMIPEKEVNGYYVRDNSSLKAAYQGLGIGYDLGGLIMLLIATKKSKTDISFDGMYNIYVYDTQTKEIIYKDTVSVSSKDTFVGSYLQFKESQSVVNDYYGKLICNSILQKYDSINQWLSFRK